METLEDPEDLEEDVQLQVSNDENLSKQFHFLFLFSFVICLSFLCEKNNFL